MIENCEKIEILPVKYDDLFHELFNENEIQTLEWTVMQILGCKYEDIKGNVKVGNIRKPKVTRKEKNKYVDLIVRYNMEHIIIELNYNFKGNYTRNLMYAFNELLSAFGKDDLSYYKKVARVILVNLNWFYKENDFGLPKKQVFELPYPNYKKQGYILKIININLDSYKKTCYNQIKESDKLYKLLTITKTADLTNLIKNEKMLTSYGNKLIDLSNDNEFKEKIMDQRIEDNLARQEGYFEGIEEGIEKKQKEIVLNMHNKNYKIEDISEITNLSVEQINEILTELEK